MTLKTTDLPKKQIEILRLLHQGPLKQKELMKKLGITGPSLIYHLERMEKNNLIKKKLIYQIGNAKNNEVSIDPMAMQYIREILGQSISKTTLVTGYGIDQNAMVLPDNALKLLKKNHYKIDKIVCFTTREAKTNRDLISKERNLLKPDRTELFDYKEYRYLESNFYKKVETIIIEEIKTSNVILDLTPLTKLLSFKFLEIANKYGLPCFYIGLNDNEAPILYWFTMMRIEGTIVT